PPGRSRGARARRGERRPPPRGRHRAARGVRAGSPCQLRRRMSRTVNDPRPSAELERLAIDVVRVLAMDAVQAANSGHPGTPMALAPVGYELWTRHLKHDPADPLWIDRDRFVLSAG